jgi:hypothetical protein
MRQDIRKNYVLGLLFILLSSPALFSQVTTATLSGIVKDPNGAPLPAATVVVEFADAGINRQWLQKAMAGLPLPTCVWAVLIPLRLLL